MPADDVLLRRISIPFHSPSTKRSTSRTLLIECVYFPTVASFSVIKLLQDGTAIEVATVGKEGVGGVVAVLNAQTHMARTIVQIPGEAYCMPIEHFQDHRKNLPRFHEITTRYAQVMYYALSQADTVQPFPSDQRARREVAVDDQRPRRPKISR